MADEVVVGAVAVEVTASARGFARSLRAEVVKSFKGIDKLLTDQLSKTKVKIPVVPDTDGFGKELPRQLPKQRMPKIPVPLDPLTNELQKQIRREANTLARRVAVKIPVTPETAELRSRLAAELAELQRRTRLQVPTEPGERRAFEAKLRAMLEAVRRDVEVKIPVEPDAKQARPKVAAAAKSLQRAAPPVMLRVDVDRRQVTQALSRLGALIRAVSVGGVAVAGIGAAIGAGAAALTGLASAAGATIPALIGLASAVATAAGTLVAVPGAVAVAAAAIGTLKLGLIGLDDAFKAIGKGDAKALNEALKKLAPNARRLVKELARLKPAFDRLRLGVQQRLFAQTDRVLRDLARQTLPTATRGMNTLAEAINRQVVAAMRDLNDRATQSTLAAVFAAATATVNNLGAALAPLGRALLDVVQVGAQLTAELSEGVGAAIGDLAAQISAMAKNGELRALFLDGLAAAKQLFALGQDIVGIFAGIARAAGGDGGGLFAFFDRLNEVINSVQGQAALGDLFDELARLGAVLTPVLLALARALVPVASGIADIAEAFAPSLVVLFTALGTALGSLSAPIAGLAPAADALAGALTPLASVLGGLIQGITPGVVALVDGLTAGFAALAPAASGVGAALGSALAALAPALAPIARVLADLIVNVAPGAIDFFAALADGLNLLAPAAPAVGKALSDLLAALAPLLPALGADLAVALTNIANLVSGVAAAFGPLVAVLAGGFTQALTVLLPVLQQWATTFLPIMAQAGTTIAEAFAPLVPILTQLAAVIAGQIADALPQLAAAAQQLLPVIAQLAAQFGQALLQALVAIAPYLPQLISAGLELAVAFAQLFAAVAPLLPPMLRFGTLLIAATAHSGGLRVAVALLTGSMNTAAAAVRVVASVVNSLLAPFRNAGAAAQGFGRAAADAASNALATFRALPGRITAAVGNLGGLLFNAGRNVVQGLIDGIQSRLGALASIASNMAGTIRDYLPFSPAKKGPLSGSGNPFFSGQSIAELLSGGMQSRTQLVASAAEDLAAQVAFPFQAAIPAPGATGGSTTYAVYPQRADFTVHDLEALQARSEARLRLGLPG